MNSSEKINNRRSIRIKDYDYSQEGAYFVTICTQNGLLLFGEIVDDKIKLNNAGNMINHWWQELPQKFTNIELDEYIIMPNHMHGIIIINNRDMITQNENSDSVGTDDNSGSVGATLVVAQNTSRGDKIGYKRAGTRPAPTIGDIIGAFKSLSTNEYIRGVKSGIYTIFDRSVWQRNYYEHVIRNEKDLYRIQSYISNNPINWKSDELDL